MIDYYLHWLNCLPYSDTSLKINILNSKIDIKSLFRAGDETELLKLLKKIDLFSFKSSSIKLFVKEVLEKTYKLKAEGSYNTIIERKINTTSYLDKDYPKRLRDIFDPPLVLYYFGNLPEVTKMSIAVVGARKASLEGLKLAYEFSKEFAQKDFNVISGLALGVDGKAHQACIDMGRPTYAVLGSGVDVPYPTTNIRLYEKICERGGVISEFPPGEKPFPNNFPRRNRIISGLADKIVLIEAGEHSGSLITADFALEQGKDIYAVPGRPGDLTSKGCNELIKNGGAALVTTPLDVL